MNPNDSVTIERVANGWQVWVFHPGSACYSISDVMVFQDMGFASAARDGQKTEDSLLGFIEAHFPPAPSSPVC